MKFTKTFVIDTPNVIRYKEHKGPKYVENFLSLTSFINENKSIKFIIIITPWMEKVLPNLSRFCAKNLVKKYSTDYNNLDPDIAAFEVSKEEECAGLISNDKFRKKIYEPYKREVNEIIKFYIIERKNENLMKCYLPR